MYRARDRAPQKDPFPAEKYCQHLPRERNRSGTVKDLSRLLDKWEEDFEMDIAGRVERATGDEYHPKFEGWNYHHQDSPSGHFASCRISFVASKGCKPRPFATYDFQPFTRKAVIVSPHEENIARTVLDRILADEGYEVVKSYDSKAA